MIILFNSSTSFEGQRATNDAYMQVSITGKGLAGEHPMCVGRQLPKQRQRLRYQELLCTQMCIPLAS
jgi:hypothetical protein